MADDYFTAVPPRTGAGRAARTLLVTLAALAAAALTAWLGLWQLDRARQRTDAQALLETRAQLPVLSAAELGRTPLALADQWQRRVRLEGEWLPQWTVALENRPMHGRVGFYLLTPLRLARDDVVLVQRGWLPRDAAERTRLPPYRSAAGVVAVEGHVEPRPARLYQLGEGAGGAIRQNLDIAGFADETGLPLRPLLIVQDAGPADDGLLRQWPAPSSGADRNRGYAVQWFALCALITGLYGWFQFIRPRLRRRP